MRTFIQYAKWSVRALPTGLSLAVFFMTLPSRATSSTKASPLSVQDRAFLADAALAILSQIQFGKIAIQKATDPQVRSYADRNVRDYSRLGETLWKLAAADQPQLPDRLSGEALRDYQRLIDRPPPRFDRLYVYMMFKWHAVALRGYRQAVKTITEPKLRAWAEQSLPLIQDHLQSIRHIAIAKGIPMNPGEGRARFEILSFC